MKDNLTMPTHVGIIMDGNGRWAIQRGKNRSYGHRAGVDTLKKVCPHINKLGVKYMSLYAFSTENFKREKAEVDFLMDLFVSMFTSEADTLINDNIKVVFSGRKEPLPKKVLTAMGKIVDRSKNNTGLVLNICLNYGGQSEIEDMTKKVCQEVSEDKIKIEDINKEVIWKHLYQDIPPLDLVIRTSGEFRLSNFMMYQASYAEFYFTKTFFPDFSTEEFDKAIEEFNNRNRRFGG